MKMIGPGVDTRTSNVSAKLRAHLSKGGGLFIRNATQPRTVVHLSWIEPGKVGRENEFIANTYLPIEITAFISPENLLRSNDFWKYIDGGHLVPLTRAAAMAELDTDEAKEERRRINEDSSQGALNASDFADVAARRANPQAHTAEDPEDYEPEVKLNKRVVGIAGRLAMPPGEGGVSVSSALADLRNMRAELTREDLAFLVGNGTVENPKTGKPDNRVSDWAQDSMMTMRQTERAAEGGKVKKTKNKKKVRV